VCIRLHDEAPGEPVAEWEDVVEVSTILPEGEAVHWQSWGGENSGELPAIKGGSYRVRVSARGRDAARADEFAPAVLDFYFVELWPAPVAEDAILRIGSKDAAYWHGEVGSRR